MNEEKKNGMAKLLAIQQRLKAPKDKTGNGLRYSYRKLEDIIENAKPIMEDEKCCLVFSDVVLSVGNQTATRYYVKSGAFLYDAETGELIAMAEAYAREAEKEPGKGESQITGSATTYARKAAAAGLFALDNSEKDADEEAADRANGQAVENTNQRMAGNRQTTAREPNWEIMTPDELEDQRERLMKQFTDKLRQTGVPDENIHGAMKAIFKREAKQITAQSLWLGLFKSDWNNAVTILRKQGFIP